MLKYRLMTTGVLIPLVVAAIFLLPMLIFTLIAFILCMLAAWEWAKLVGFDSRLQRIWLVILYSFLMVIIIMSVRTDHCAIPPPLVRGLLWSSLAWWVAAFILVILYPRSSIIWKNSYFLRLLFGILTIIPFFLGIIALRNPSSEANSFSHAWRLLYVILLACGTDSGAYIFGKLFGQHKLAPQVSPSKTWEGLMGGLMTTALSAWMLSKYAPLSMEPLTLIACSTIAVLASVVGDLTESMFKRAAGIKDSGHLMPGHGGILDRIDSLTATVPVFACLILLVF